MPRILIAVPACREFKYGRWESEESPHYNPANAPYCKDIHISGPNPRIQAVRDTWWKDVTAFSHHVDAKFFYGAGNSVQATDEVIIPVADDYEHLPHKTQAICRWALQNNYDFLFKCDDDTAVYVERLILEVLHGAFDYAGFSNGEVCTGGPGYFLSRRAMQIVANSGPPEHWAEDVNTSIVLGRHAVNAVMLPGHTPGYHAHWIFPNGFTAERLKELGPDLVTLHAMQPEVLRDWYVRRNG